MSSLILTELKIMALCEKKHKTSCVLDLNQNEEKI